MRSSLPGYLVPTNIHGQQHITETRNPDQPAAEKLRELGAEVVAGDFDDADSLQRALDGVDAAFSVQNMSEGIDAEQRWGIAFADISDPIFPGILSRHPFTNRPHDNADINADT